MKKLLISLFLLMPVLSYAQNPDIEKARRILNDLYRRNESNGTNSQGNSSSSSTERATPKPGVVTKNLNVKTSEQRKQHFNEGMDAFNKANEVTYLIGGKTPTQIAIDLMNGNAPENVTVNYLKSEMANLPVTQRHLIAKEIKKKAESIANAHQNDYDAQFQRVESKIKSKGHSINKDQVGQYVQLRMSGKALNKPYSKDVIDEVDKAAVEYKKVKDDKQRISKLKSYLNQLKAECGGKCD